MANAVYPDRPSTAEEWRYDDEHFDTRFANERYVAAHPGTVEYARTHGVRELRTWNEIHNQRMLAINEKFGFVRQPAWIS